MVPNRAAESPDHEEFSIALTARVRAGVRLVTTNLVIAETHALLAIRAGPSTALAFLHHATTAPTEVVTSTPALELEAQTAWLARFADQDFSLTDPVSFAVMTRRRIRDALTLDHYFALAGFQIVPRRKDPPVRSGRAASVKPSSTSPFRPEQPCAYGSFSSS